MVLTLVHARKVVCPAWHCRGLDPVFGGACRTCSRDVAIPLTHRGDTPICTYCALDDGLIPAIEIEP